MARAIFYPPVVAAVVRSRTTIHFVATSIWTSLRENLNELCANNKGADQTAYPRSLISAFVIRSLEIILPKLDTCNVSVI